MTGRAHALFGKGYEALFPVDPYDVRLDWDGSLLRAPTTLVPWPRATGPDLYDQVLVREALVGLKRGIADVKDFDPRELHATQESITNGGVRYYLKVDLRGPDYETYADQHNIGNKYPVIYEHPSGKNLLLSGHHRSAVSLVRGDPVRAVRVPSVPTETCRMVTPFLFLGGAPPDLDDVVWVEAVSDVVEVIANRGGTAALPPDAWELAEQALHVLSPNGPEAVARQVQFARSGQL